MSRPDASQYWIKIGLASTIGQTLSVAHWQSRPRIFSVFFSVFMLSGLLIPYRLKEDRIHAMTLLPFAAFNPTIDLKMGKLIPD